MRSSSKVVVEWAGVFLAIAYAMRFLYFQTIDLGDPHVLEWDSRASNLVAYRFHDSGLFQDDLPSEYYSAMSPPGWKAIFWLGTLFSSPVTFSKLLPFVLFAILLWQVYQLAASWGGPLLGAGALVLFVHNNFFWDRMVGGNPRAFGFPLLVAFLRYAITGETIGALLVLIAQTLFYPSAFLLCFPVYCITQIFPVERRKYFRLVALTVICGAICWVQTATVDARIGKATSYQQLAGLEQRFNWSLYPLPSARSIIDRVHRTATHQTWGKQIWPKMGGVRMAATGLLFTFTTVLLAFVAGRRLKKFPLVLPLLFVVSLVGFYLARAVAYRLYIPDRMIEYSWPVIALVTFIFLAFVSLPERLGWTRSLVAALFCVGFQFVFYGDGLPKKVGLHDWSSRDTAAVKFIATLPKSSVVGAKIDESTYVQVFAQRKTLFSAITNGTNLFPYGLTVETRIKDFCRAYYASNLEALRRYVHSAQVDYFLVDTRDFGSQAMDRARYTEPWTSLARSLLQQTPKESLIFANPPAEAILFRDGPMAVIDAHRL